MDPPEQLHACQRVLAQYTALLERSASIRDHTYVDSKENQMRIQLISSQLPHVGLLVAKLCVPPPRIHVTSQVAGESLSDTLERIARL
jgi:hypothetical protein